MALTRTNIRRPHMLAFKRIVIWAFITALIAACQTTSPAQTPPTQISPTQVAPTPIPSTQTAPPPASLTPVPPTQALTPVPPTPQPSTTPQLPPPVFGLSSPAFNDGQDIPAAYSCDGQNRSPALEWVNAPKGTASFALIVIDPDARDFTHWVQFDF